MARLREALQTLPFFGSAKAVWFQNCSFLGDERAANTKAVREALADLAQDLKQFSWKDVRLLISAGKVDLSRKALMRSNSGFNTAMPFWLMAASSMQEA